MTIATSHRAEHPQRHYRAARHCLTPSSRPKHAESRSTDDCTHHRAQTRRTCAARQPPLSSAQKNSQAGRRSEGSRNSSIASKIEPLCIINCCHNRSRGVPPLLSHQPLVYVQRHDAVPCAARALKFSTAVRSRSASRHWVYDSFVRIVDEKRDELAASRKRSTERHLLSLMCWMLSSRSTGTSVP